MGATAYLVHEIIWQDGRDDLPDRTVVYIPDWFCTAQDNAKDHEWNEIVHERLTKRFDCLAVEIAFRPASREEEEELAANVGL